MISKINYIRKLLGKDKLNHSIIFVHIHKCGGSSIENMFKQLLSHSFATQKAIKIQAAESHNAAQIISGNSGYQHTMLLREMLVAYYIMQQKKFITGHFYFSEKWYNLAKNNYKIVTILRHPVKRWFSQYFFNRYKKSNHNKIDIPLEEYILSPEAINAGITYINYFGGCTKKYSVEKNIEIAKNNIDKFDVVGCIENLIDFENKLKQKLCISDSLKIPQINMSPKSESFKENQITKEIEARVYEICKPDIEIYNYVNKQII